MINFFPMNICFGCNHCSETFEGKYLGTLFQVEGIATAAQRPVHLHSSAMTSIICIIQLKCCSRKPMRYSFEEASTLYFASTQKILTCKYRIYDLSFVCSCTN